MNNAFQDQQAFLDVAVNPECLNEGHSWQIASKEDLRPNPNFFGKRTYWFTRCCGKGMLRCKRVQQLQCGKCGQRKEQITNNYIALCPMCGKEREPAGLDY